MPSRFLLLFKHNDFMLLRLVLPLGLLFNINMPSRETVPHGGLRKRDALP
jgi:hypothetical protein